VGAEVGWHLRYVQSEVVDVWAFGDQAGVFEDLAATFGQWSMTREDVDGAVRFRFKRQVGAGK